MQALISETLNLFINISNVPNFLNIPIINNDVIFIRNRLILISNNIKNIYPDLSSELFRLKDMLFYNGAFIQPIVFGEIIAILRHLNYVKFEGDNFWNIIHPQIVNASQKLFESGNFVNAACDAFIEINSKVKKIYKYIKPNEIKIPDGDSLMTTVFSVNKPLLTFCDINSETGLNVQRGYMQLLQGAMAALRNPKCHDNFSITKEDSIRRLMLASMLMYAIDDALIMNKINFESILLK